MKLNSTQKDSQLLSFRQNLVPIFALAITLFYTGFSATVAHAQVEPQHIAPALTVTSETPKTVEWPILINAYGVIAPWQEASISAQIGGYQLVEVLVNVGDVVKKNQVLARFNRSILLMERAELLANAEQARANLNRITRLSNDKAVSEQDLLQAKTQAKVADALLAKNQLQLKYTDIIAPEDGVISSRTATVGAAIPVGQELFQIILQQRLEWRGEVTATQYHQILAGQSVSLILPDGSSTTAIVRQKSPTFDDNTRLATIYADIQKQGHAVAGMYVSGSITLGMSQAQTVPVKSVIIRDGRNYVLSIDELTNSSTVSMRPVKTGRSNGVDIEILTGLTGVNHVVVEGAGFLSGGDLVRVVSSSHVTGRN